MVYPPPSIFWNWRCPWKVENVKVAKRALSPIADSWAKSLLCLSTLVTGCGGELGPPIDENSIFPGTELIEIGSPGPMCRVSTQPTFSWKATGRKLVFVGIFVANISVRDGQIVNVGENVWAWNSGLGTGREGNVFYTQ